MPVLEIPAEYDGDIWYYNATYEKRDTLADISAGRLVPKGATQGSLRAYMRFPLASLPAGAVVSQVRLRLYEEISQTVSGYLLNIRAYHTNGQTDPQPDTGATLYSRSASGNLYLQDSRYTAPTAGIQWFLLGGTVNEDVENAKTAVNFFSLALQEDGDDQAAITWDSIEAGTYPPLLEITYEVPPPPPVGYQYSDGLVTVRVGG